MAWVDVTTLWWGQWMLSRRTEGSGSSRAKAQAVVVVVVEQKEQEEQQEQEEQEEELEKPAVRKAKWPRFNVSVIAQIWKTIPWYSSTIAEEIHAPDRAAQGTVEGGKSDFQDLGLEVDDVEPPFPGVRILELLTRRQTRLPRHPHHPPQPGISSRLPLSPPPAAEVASTPVCRCRRPSPAASLGLVNGRTQVHLSPLFLFAHRC
jgi:hypothetical protein